MHTVCSTSGTHEARDTIERRKKKEEEEVERTKTKGDGESKRTLARQDTRERTSNLVASECYISPERPCCFFNARTTFTPNERAENAIEGEAFDDPAGRIDRSDDDRYSLLVLCPLTRRRFEAVREKKRILERGRGLIYRFAMKRENISRL